MSGGWLAQKHKGMWIAILIVVTIIGAVIGYCIVNDDDVLWGILIGGALFFAICLGIKLLVTDKSFICTDVSFAKTTNANDQKTLYKNKVEALGSKMVLEFFDNSVKCTSIYKQKEEEISFSFVLDEISVNELNKRHIYQVGSVTERHVYQVGSVTMELNEWAFFITSFIIEDEKGQKLTFKRKYF